MSGRTVTSLPAFLFTDVVSAPERREGKLWCPISQAPMTTEFAISRFCVPFIQTDGWALFVDCDALCLADISKLFALADARFAVQVVKHAQQGGASVKMDGQAQTFYARKNWSSVILWNCSHPAHHRLTHAPQKVCAWPSIFTLAPPCRSEEHTSELQSH